MHSPSPSPALTLTLTLTLNLTLNHLANKQLRSTNASNSQINGSVTDYEHSSLLISKFWRNPDVIYATRDFRTPTCVNKKIAFAKGDLQGHRNFAGAR